MMPVPMQVNPTTREVYAASHAIASGEEIELITIAPCSYCVWCWNTAEDEVRWTRDFGSDIKAAVEEYNRWAKVSETAPVWN